MKTLNIYKKLNLFHLFTCALIFQLLSMTANSALSKSLENLNFKLSSAGFILVELDINGEGPFTIALDTGSGKTIISPNTGLFAPKPNLAEDASIQGPTHKRSAQSETLKSLSIGGISLKGIKVRVMGLSHISRGDFLLNGILGQDILSTYDIKIDFPNRQLSFYTKASNLTSCEVCNKGGTDIPFENDFGGLIKFKITFNELTIPSILDMGTGITTVNKATVFALGFDMRTLRAGEPNQGHNSKRSNIKKIEKILKDNRKKNEKNSRARERWFVTLKDEEDEEYINSNRPQLKEYRIPISKVTYEGVVLNRHHSIAYMELPAFREFGFRAEPLAFVGTDLFQNKVVRISNGLKLLSISNAELLLINP